MTLWCNDKDTEIRLIIKLALLTLHKVFQHKLEYAGDFMLFILATIHTQQNFPEFTC